VGSGTPSGTATPRPRLRVRRVGIRLPVALGREAVVTVGHEALVAGGLVGGDTSTAAAYRIDLRTGRVTTLPPMPVPVHDTAGASAAGVPLVVGGGNAAEQSVVQAWRGGRWHVAGHLPQARSDLVAASVGGRVVVLGGYDGTRPAEPTILASSDGDRWRTIGRLPVPVRYAAPAVSEGAVWLFGGETGGAERSAIQRVDPATGRARVVGRLPVPLGHAAAIPLGGRILLAGGRTGPETVTDRMWWFDPRTDAVNPAGHLPHPLADSAVAHGGGRYFLVGGETPDLSREVLAVSLR
jgi:N-acetylneuraminic acid mutarotase